VHTGFWWEKLREREHWEEYGLDGSIIFKSVFKKWDEGVDWIGLAQHGDRWQDLVDAVIKHSVSNKSRGFADYLKTC